MTDQPSGTVGEETSPESVAESDPDCTAPKDDVEVNPLGDGPFDSETSVQPALALENSDSASITAAATEPKRIAYPQIVKEGRRFNIDLISKVGNSLTVPLKISLFKNLCASLKRFLWTFQRISKIIMAILGPGLLIPDSCFDKSMFYASFEGIRFFKIHTHKNKIPKPG